MQCILISFLQTFHHSPPGCHITHICHICYIHTTTHTRGQQQYNHLKPHIFTPNSDTHATARSVFQYAQIRCGPWRRVWVRVSASLLHIPKRLTSPVLQRSTWHLRPPHPTPRTHEHRPAARTSAAQPRWRIVPTRDACRNVGTSRVSWKSGPKTWCTLWVSLKINIIPAMLCVCVVVPIIPFFVYLDNIDNRDNYE